MALNALGRTNEASEAFDKAATLPKQPMSKGNTTATDAVAWSNKGNALKALGRIEEANAAFAKAKELGYTN